MFKDLIHNPGFRRLWIGAMVCQVLLAGIALRLPEMADEPYFKVWANRVVDQGIHKAYARDGFDYDWLPFYLYLSKGVGSFYRYSGLYDLFGPYSRMLMLVLKCAMIGFNGLSGILVYFLSKQLFRSERDALQTTGAVLFNPALMLATSAFGYQEALHTVLVVLAVWSLCSGMESRVPVWCALACLTKPQAVILMVPIGVLFIKRCSRQEVIRGLGTGLLTVVLVVAPFLIYGNIGGVFQMYLDVPRIHQWLTGCAHNIWWLFWPAPPFLSDREPLIGGINGLTIGLVALLGFSLGMVRHLVRQSSKENLIQLCAFAAFVFFMVVTEIHENYLYAMFPFLAIVAQRARPLKWIYIVLTGTFALDMVLTAWLIATGTPVLLGPIRPSVVNAGINVGVLVWWSYLVFSGRFSRWTET